MKIDPKEIHTTPMPTPTINAARESDGLAKDRLRVFNHESKALIDSAFALVANDSNPPNFRCAGYMRAAVGLDVEASDVYHTDFLDILGEKIDFGADQVRLKHRLLPRQKAD